MWRARSGRRGRRSGPSWTTWARRRRGQRRWSLAAPRWSGSRWCCPTRRACTPAPRASWSGRRPASTPGSGPGTSASPNEGRAWPASMSWPSSTPASTTPSSWRPLAPRAGRLWRRWPPWSGPASARSIRPPAQHPAATRRRDSGPGARRWRGPGRRRRRPRHLRRPARYWKGWPSPRGSPGAGPSSGAAPRLGPLRGLTGRPRRSGPAWRRPSTRWPRSWRPSRPGRTRPRRPPSSRPRPFSCRIPCCLNRPGGRWRRASRPPWRGWRRAGQRPPPTGSWPSPSCASGPRTWRMWASGSSAA